MGFPMVSMVSLSKVMLATVCNLKGQQQQQVAWKQIHMFSRFLQAVGSLILIYFDPQMAVLHMAVLHFVPLGFFTTP